MQIVRFRAAGKTRYGVLEGSAIVEYAGTPWSLFKRGRRRYAVKQVVLLAPTQPSKIVAVGLNYRDHAAETKLALPNEPTLFLKATSALAGPDDDLVMPRDARSVDWEVELGVIIGAPAYRVDEAEAAACIAGYTVVNDISLRDWQVRTPQWDQGKNFEASTPVGPFLVTPDELGDPEGSGAVDLEVTTRVDGQTMQQARTCDLLFNPAAIVSYSSQFTTLRPGDLIATGTPGGVGAGRDHAVVVWPGTLRL
jgi:acylpyruvate hydrolase